MGRPRTPTAVLEVKGAFKKHPERKEARSNEPIAAGALGEPPKRLTTKLRELWYELIEQVPAGVLTSADRWLVEMTVRMQHLVIQGEATSVDKTLLSTCLGKMGCNPADRSRLSVPKQAEEKNPFAEFVQ